MRKRGISVVVAVIFIILITLVSVTIFWTIVLPMINDELGIIDLGYEISIETKGGYTYFDENAGIACVQIKRMEETKDLKMIRVLFVYGGTTIEDQGNFSGEEISGINFLRQKCFNLTFAGTNKGVSPYVAPGSVKIVPVYFDGGREVEGDIAPSVEDLSKGVWEGGIAYMIGSGLNNVLPGVEHGAGADPNVSELGIGEVIPVQNIFLNQTFLLHSNPSATKTIYLDFDGHVTKNTQWNSQFSASKEFTSPAYSFEGGADFSDAELDRIQKIWRRVSEDYSPFDVDVTTEEPSEAALQKESSEDDDWGNRIVVGGRSSDWYGSNVGGVAFMETFNWRSDTPAYVFSSTLGNSEKYVSEAISHETGHTLGLRHDGKGSSTYYSGHGSGATGWAPIMGNGYFKQVSQFSKGEYAGATRTEDDLLIIVSINGVGYRVDDYGNNISDANSLEIAKGGNVSEEGIIEQTTDVDYFSFTTSGASISLTIDSFYLSPNLDINASLYDSSGDLIASDNPVNALGAGFDLDLSAGTYYISVDGAGKGTVDNGYSDYGSIGYYSISGTIVALSSSCGNGVKDGTDVCDGQDVDGESCVSQGFVSGTLGCLAGCDEFDTSECVEPEQATINTWSCNTNEVFTNPSCWSLGRIPIAGDRLVFNSSGTGDININQNTMPQDLDSFIVESGYTGNIYFNSLFAVGAWGINQGTQEWNVANDINILGGTMYVYGDYPYNITAEGHGQIWKSLAGDINVGSGATLDGVGLGFAIGTGPGKGGSNIPATHGGKGYRNRLDTYGDASAPTSLGSGADNAGGSAIKLSAVSGTLLVDGTINMNSPHSGNNDGGAGGSIWLVADNIGGDGYLLAEGGDRTRDGGGGRIRLDFNSFSYDGAISTAGGTTGRPGTFSWGNVAGVTNYIWPENGWTLNGSVGLLGGNYTINGDLVIPSGTTLGIQAVNFTASDNGQGVIINVIGDITIQPSGKIDGDREGFKGTYGPAASEGGLNQGGSHGGKGKGNEDATYGSETHPLSLGSGGEKTSESRYGGGAVKLESTQNIIVNGEITVKNGGIDAEGGAGGSIWLVADNIMGTGTIDASGGIAGGGGRIALHADTIDFSGAIDNKGDSGAGGGTIYIDAATSITSSGNITTIGADGGNITVIDTLLTFSGNYDASTIGAGNGGSMIFNYTDCSSNFLSADFSPIPIYNTLCDTPPSSVLISPADDYLTNYGAVEFVCDAVDASSLSNVTLYVWDSGGNLVRTDSKTISGQAASAIFSYNFALDGSYQWNCLVYDNAGKFDWGSNRTISFELCGNGFEEGIEACDDGNNNDGDGCSSLCTLDNCVDDVGVETCIEGDTYCSGGYVPAANTVLCCDVQCTTPVIKNIYVDNSLGSDCVGGYDVVSQSCGDGGSDDAYNSFASVADVASPGDTVLIRGGTYGQTLRPGNSGAPGLYITYKNYPGETVTITGATLEPAIDLGNPARPTTGKSYIIIDGLNVDYVYMWMYAVNAHYNIIRNNYFGRSRSGSSKSGVFFQEATYNKILNNTFYDISEDGLSLIKSDRNLIEGNNFTNAGHALWVVKCGNFNVIRNNYFSNPTQKIGEIYDCGTSSASSSTLPGFNHLIDSPNNTKYNLVESNTFAFTMKGRKANQGTGIQYAGQNGIIRKNLFYKSNVGLGVSSYANEGLFNLHNRVYHNVFYENECGGIVLRSGSDRFIDNIFKNNILYKNRGTETPDEVNCYSNNPAQIVYGKAEFNGSIFERNNFIYNQAGETMVCKEWGNCQDLVYSESHFPQAFPADEQRKNLELAPGFVDELNYDFHLAEGSKMIDAGIFLTTVVSVSGNDLVVEDAGYFYDGFGISGEEGDVIQLENSLETATITDINYATNTLTLDGVLSASVGRGVGLAYSGSGPDLGAYEFGGGEVVEPPVACDLTSASWSSTTANVGNSVGLNVVGVGCGGENISYEVWENVAWWFDSKVMDSATVGSTSWTADAEGSYYFYATSEGGDLVESDRGSDLVVSGVVEPPVCGNNIIEGGEVCDDEKFCNGVETCEDGVGCVDDVAVVTDDGVGCTVDVCDEVGDVILHNADDSRCEVGKVCDLSKGCVEATCEYLGGEECVSGEYCSEERLGAVDTKRCCSVQCEEPSWSLCSECGDGWFNLCDESECNTVVEGCYFVDSGLTGFGGECNSCYGVVCGDYENEVGCERDRCEVDKCGWRNGECRVKNLVGDRGNYTPGELPDCVDVSYEWKVPVFSINHSACDDGNDCTIDRCTREGCVRKINYSDADCSAKVVGCVDADGDGLLDYGVGCLIGTDRCVENFDDFDVARKTMLIPLAREVNLSFGNISDVRDVSGFIVFKEGVARIRYKDKIRLVGYNDTGCYSRVHIDPLIEFGASGRKVRVYADLETGFSELNKSAEITYYNVSFDYPKILRDGVECSDCVIVSYNKSSKEFVIDVSGFSEYEIVEGSAPVVPNVPSTSGTSGSSGTSGALDTINDSVNDSSSVDGEGVNTSEVDEIDDEGSEEGIAREFSVEQKYLGWIIIFIISVVLLVAILTVFYLSRFVISKKLKKKNAKKKVY